MYLQTDMCVSWCRPSSGSSAQPVKRQSWRQVMVSVSEQLCEDHNLEDDSSMSSAVFSCLKQPGVSWPALNKTSAEARHQGERVGFCTCTGHAAASPKAQMVWPSICLVTSHSMSISSTRASPFFMRVMMSYSQGAPSLQWHPSASQMQSPELGHNLTHPHLRHGALSCSNFSGSRFIGPRCFGCLAA